MPLELCVAGEVSYFDDSDTNTAMQSPELDNWGMKPAGIRDDESLL